MGKHGGVRKGAGRPSKDAEQKAKRLTISALVKEFGSEQKAFEYAAKQIKAGDKSSFAYFKLLIEYGYGKPKESLDLTSGDLPIQNLSGLSNSELAILLKIHDRNATTTNEE